MYPVRANTCGSFDVKAISSVTDPPGGTGSGSVTLATVWSSLFPSSGWMNASVGLRSAPAEVAIDVMSIQPQPSLAISSPRSWPPDSFTNVDFVFLKAFRYRWNCSSDTASVVDGFRQVSVCLPVNSCFAGSSATLIW